MQDDQRTIGGAGALWIYRSIQNDKHYKIAFTVPYS